MVKPSTEYAFYVFLEIQFSIQNIPKFFWVVDRVTFLLLKINGGWGDFWIVSKNMAFLACLFGPGLKFIFHWKVQFFILLKSSFKFYLTNPYHVPLKKGCVIGKLNIYPTVTNFTWFSHISVCYHALTHSRIFSKMSCNFTISISYHSITHSILFHWTHSCISIPNNIPFMFFRDSFRVKNMESIHHWYPGKGISCNIATSKPQNNPR